MNVSRFTRLTLVVCALLAAYPRAALAYAGPGGVLTAVGALVALLAAIAASILGFVWYPLKRLRSWLRQRHRSPDARESPEPGDSG